MREFGPALRSMAQDQHFLTHNREAHLPALSHHAIDSLRPSEALESVSKVFFPHQMIVHDQTSKVNFRHSNVYLGSISLNQIAYGADVEVLVNDLMRSHFVLVMALSGEAMVHHGEQCDDFMPGDSILMCPDTRYRFEMCSDHNHLAIGIPVDRLIGSGKPVRDVHSVMERSSALESGGAGALLSFLDYVCSELHARNPIFDLEPVVASNEASLIAQVRASLFDGTMTDFHPCGLPGFVRRADQFITEHLTDDITLDDIIGAAGVPARTLYHGFERFVGHSPKKWLRMRRIEAARADIIASEGTIAITDLALRYWIGHAGRFASLYRQIYGEAPSVTLARVRENAIARGTGKNEDWRLLSH